MGIADEKYMSFTTYRRSGDPVSTPVWVVPLMDGRVGFWTSMGSGKTKRLTRDPRVVLQGSDARGRVKDGTSPVDGTAELVQSGAAFDEVQAKIAHKYGFMTKVTKVLGKLGPQGRKGLTYGDTVVLIALGDVNSD